MPYKRLLVLDDDSAVSRTIGLFARGVEFDTRTTSRPDDFFHELEHWHPTHIALDLIMPAMDGVEVMRRLANRHCTARIIITSGVGNRVLDAASRAAAERGLDIAGVLSKPFSPSSLRELLSQPSPRAHSYLDQEPSTITDGSLITESRLRRALENGEFHLDFQPKIACKTRQIAGFEALVRWNYPGLGTVMPDQFVPLAEHAGLICKLTEQVLKQGLQWLSSNFPDDTINLSLNLSAKSLVDEYLSDYLLGLCQQYAVKPERLILELTESSAMEDPVASLDLLTRLRMKGFKLSIDDFGTGYSSMVQLVRLPFSELKVDKSFVQAASQSQEARTVIRSVIELGHSLGLRVTAEGIEDAEALRFVSKLGCDFAQGYWVARPLAKDDVRHWTSEWSASNKLSVLPTPPL